MMFNWRESKTNYGYGSESNRKIDSTYNRVLKLPLITYIERIRVVNYLEDDYPINTTVFYSRHFGCSETIMFHKSGIKGYLFKIYNRLENFIRIEEDGKVGDYVNRYKFLEKYSIKYWRNSRIEKLLD